MRSILWRLGFSLRTNNNVRWVTVWVGIILHLFFNLVVIGFGPPLEPAFEDLTEMERKILKIFDDPIPMGEPVLDKWLRFVMWSALAVEMLGAALYTPFAFWDEIRRALRAVGRRFREERGQAVPQASVQTGAQPSPAQQQAPATSQNLFVWIREVIAAAIANAFFH